MAKFAPLASVPAIVLACARKASADIDAHWRLCKRDHVPCPNAHDLIEKGKFMYLYDALYDAMNEAKVKYAIGTDLYGFIVHWYATIRKDIRWEAEEEPEQRRRAFEREDCEVGPSPCQLLWEAMDRYYNFKDEDEDSSYYGEYEDQYRQDEEVIAASREEFNKEYAERVSREACEASAAQFARTCGFPVGSEQYLRALREAVSNAEEAREEECYGDARAERWGRVAFGGCSAEAMWDHEDCIQVRHGRVIDDLYRVLQYLENNFPLLLLKEKQG